MKGAYAYQIWCIVALLFAFLITYIFKKTKINVNVNVPQQSSYVETQHSLTEEETKIKLEGSKKILYDADVKESNIIDEPRN